MRMQAVNIFLKIINVVYGRNETHILKKNTKVQVFTLPKINLFLDGIFPRSTVAMKSF